MHFMFSFFFVRVRYKDVYLLYRTEEEIGLDNLKEVEVPSEYMKKFHEMDKDFINNKS